jgi:hypothetical protein
MIVDLLNEVLERAKDCPREYREKLAEYACAMNSSN